MNLIQKFFQLGIVEINGLKYGIFDYIIITYIFYRIFIYYEWSKEIDTFLSLSEDEQEIYEFKFNP